MARAITTAGKPRTRKTQPAKPNVKSGARGDPPPPPSKTAVVVIHGIGEQRPLETLREFVETVYRRDPSIASMAAAPGDLLNMSVVPDDVTGSAELRRITTHSDGPQKRTDFFEFYWADIMDGTPLDMVTGWIRTLLLRSPFRLPRALKVKFAWAVLLLLVALIVTAGAIAAYPGFGAAVAEWTPVQMLGAWLVRERSHIAGVLIDLAALWLAWRVVRAKARLNQVSIGGPLAVFTTGLVLSLLPEAMVGSIQAWAAVATAGIAYGMHALVAPYAGDVVRYVRATPSTVERRRLVRERGMALLEALHKKRLHGPSLDAFTQAPKDDPPLYDRIVIVGHSLGTIVGYDILQLFWEKYGPTHHQEWGAETKEVQDALKACDAYVKAAWTDTDTEFDMAGFAAAQAKLFAVLSGQSLGWRISDFITLGCPLTHAEFLLVDNPDQVKQAAKERRFATAPPRPDPFLENTMLFTRTGLALKPDGTAEPLFPHFAAQFAAVKWTNIFDESPNPLLGDLISGRLSDDFGPGIDERRVSIRRPGRPSFLGRVFTHTQYWSWHPSYEPSAANVAAAAVAMAKPDEAKRRELLWHNVPDHIRQLRLALRLGT